MRGLDEFLQPRDQHECQWCEDDPDMTPDDCAERAANEYEDAMTERAEARREAGDD